MAEVTPSGGVDAQVGGDEQRRDMARDAGLAQRRDGGGDAIEHVADRRQRLLDGAEPALDGGLRGGRALALRRVLEAERGVRLRGSLGEVRRALVGDELHALAPGGRVGHGADDQVLGLALVDGERVEQAALAVADVLHTDELEADAEDAQVRGIAAELGVGRRRLEREPPRVAVVAWRWRRLGWRRRRRGLVRAVLPRAERALGERERGTERARGDAMLAVDAVERAHELVLHVATTQRRLAQREPAGGDSEERLEHGRALVAWRSRASPAPGRRCEQLRERGAQPGLGATDPLGAWPSVGDQLGHRPREPRGIVVSDDARADQRDQKTGLLWSFLRSRGWHGSPSVSGRKLDCAELPVPVQEIGYGSTLPSTTRRPPRCSSA